MSTYYNYSVKTRDDLKQWILRKLGAPLIRIELTDDQIELAINDALEFFGKYASYEQRYFCANIEAYEYYEGECNSPEGMEAQSKFEEGLKLPENVVGINQISEMGMDMMGGINNLFSVGNQMMNAGMLPDMTHVHRAGGWLTYHNAMESLELSRKMMGGGYQFDFNYSTKRLSLQPNPKKQGAKGILLIGCYIASPEEQNLGDYYVKQLSLAYSQIMLGIIREKYSGMSLVGGGAIDTSIGDKGQSLLEKIEEEIKDEFLCTFDIGIG
jgi:hypothetical protein